MLEKREIDKYIEYVKKRKELKLPNHLTDFFQIQQKIIKKSLDQTIYSPLSCCTSYQNRNDVTKQFEIAFSNLSHFEKKDYYIQCLKCTVRYIRKKQENHFENLYQVNSFKIYLKGGPLKMFWLQYQLQIDFSNLNCRIRNQETFFVDFKDYLIRRSNIKDKQSFALQAIVPNRQNIYKIGFDSQQKYLQCFNIIYNLMMKAHQQNIIFQLKQFQDQFLESKRQFGSCINCKQQKHQQHGKNRGYNDQQQDYILQGQYKNNIKNQTKKMISKKQLLNYHQQKIQFDHFLENYPLNDVQFDKNYHIISNEQQKQQSNCIIVKYSHEYNKYKLRETLQFPLKKVVAAIVDLKNYNQWNQQVINGNIQLFIPRDNTQIASLKIKPYKQQHKQREFLFLRQLFIFNSYTYIIDKSILWNFQLQNKIQTGEIIYQIWSLKQNINSQTDLIMEIAINHKSILTNSQKTYLSQNYIRQFKKLKDYIKNVELESQIEFDLYWSSQFVKSLQKKLIYEKSMFRQNLCSPLNSSFKSVQHKQDNQFQSQFQQFHIQKRNPERKNKQSK